ncbi:hypothetical protein [Geomonas agri]|uniref:hypothetical protein n=1 Tax=Geomonas agri TaxID=2873702 RepID=UPI001CD65FA3|nr:hypothetical protein [Geomonas agri]
MTNDMNYIELEPSDLPVFSHLATWAEEQIRLFEADLTQCTEGAKEDVYASLSVFHLLLGDIAAAEEHYQKALNLDPNRERPLKSFEDAVEQDLTPLLRQLASEGDPQEMLQAAAFSAVLLLLLLPDNIPAADDPDISFFFDRYLELLDSGAVPELDRTLGRIRGFDTYSDDLVSFFELALTVYRQNKSGEFTYEGYEAAVYLERIFEVTLALSEEILYHLPHLTGSDRAKKEMQDGWTRRIEEQQRQIELEKAVIEARDIVIQNLCHSIKNIVRNAISPLETAKSYILTGNLSRVGSAIDTAKIGINIIREMTSAATLSFHGTEQDFYSDASTRPTEWSLYSIILCGMTAAIGNVLNGDIFYDAIRSGYFKDSDTLFQCRGEFLDLATKEGETQEAALAAFAEKYLFGLDLRINDAKGLFLSTERDNKGAYIKFHTILGEILLNAVKYASSVTRKSRKIRVRLAKQGNNLVFEVDNSFSPNVPMTSTGLGNVIIDNIARVMGAPPPERTHNNRRYVVNLKFSNFWEGEK